MTNPNNPPPLYVGYLPLPAPHRRLLRRLLPALGVLVVALALTVAALQRDPGPGRWAPDAEPFTGTLVCRPYPILLPDDPARPPLLIVAQGKFGAAPLADLDGARVELRGRPLVRADAHMLELDSAHAPQRLAGPAQTTPNTPPTPAVLRGEIVDSKCCLGAMKPGEGKTHRACATLCIRGGIPPILVSAAPDGTPVYTLLTDRNGNPANDIVIPYIAEPVRITGAVTEIAGLAVMRIDAIQPGH